MQNEKVGRLIQNYFSSNKNPSDLSELFGELSTAFDLFDEKVKALENINGESHEKNEALISTQQNKLDELTTLFEKVEDVFFSVSFPDRKLVQMSSACVKVYGYSSDEFANNMNLWYQVVVKEDKPILEEKFPVMFAGGNFSMVYRINHTDGSIRWVETKVTSTLDSKGFLIRIDGITADITSRKRSEIALIASEDKFRSLFENMADGVYKSTSDGKFIDVNPALITMLGYESKEALMVIDIKSDLYFDENDRNEEPSTSSSEGISVYRLKKKNGTEIWVEDRGSFITDDNGTILYHEGVLRDVTERIHTAMKLSVSMKETADYKKALDESLIISIKDRKGIITHVNDNFCNISKYSREELIGCTYEILSSGFHSEEFTSGKIDTIESGEVWKGEIKNRAKDGTFFWVDTTIVPFLNEYGVPYQYLTIRADITERKNAELALEQTIVDLKKTNAELDKFVYSVSHDLRAPLSSMLGIIDIAKDDAKSEISIRHFNMIKGSILKLDGFILDILDYSRNCRMERKNEEINFNDLLNDITQNLKYMGKGNKSVEIKIKVDEKASILSDRSRLIIILNNLISNAIRYQNEQIENPFVDIKIDMSDTETDIVIKDNGIGIHEHLQEKVFDMFYRVSENSVGTGLGLYIVKESVNKLNGSIVLLSEIGKGSTFIVKLPNH